MNSIGFMVMLWLPALILGVAVPRNYNMVTQSQQRSGDATTFTDIIDTSLEKITGKLRDPSDIRKFLNKHFFTGEKQLSAWPKAIQETEKMYGMDFSERDLMDMQTTLRNIYKNILDCDEELKESKRDDKALIKHAKCYDEIYKIIASDGEVRFGLPAGSDVGQARMLSLNIAYNLMRLLFLQMSQNLSIKAGLNPLDMTKPIIDISVELIKSYQGLQESANTTRLSAVSAVNLCTQVTIFYKDFDEVCSPSPIPYSKLQIAGGSFLPLFQRKLRATVKDEVTGENICDLQENNNKKSTKESLIKRCEKIRVEHINKLSKDMNSYFNKRTKSVIDSLPLLWGKSNKKLKVFSEKIGTVSNY